MSATSNRLTVSATPHHGLTILQPRNHAAVMTEKRTSFNKDHLPKLIELGLVELREGTPHLTTAGQIAAWQGQVG